MTLPEAALLGLIQGLTEFLPISSTAHLLIARRALGHPNPQDGFTTVIQLGTLIAVFVFFRSDLLAMLKAVLADLKVRRFAASTESRLAWLIVLGTLPVVAIGAAFNKFIKATFYDPISIAVVAIVFSLLMLAAELWHRKRKQGNGTVEITAERLTWKESLWMGCWQALALLPGASRSGTTITGGLFAGLERGTAARFSFLLSLPAILGAGLKDLYDEYKLLKDPSLEPRPSLFASSDDVLALLVATAVSAIVGYAAIAWLMKFLSKQSMLAFVVYRLVLAAVILIAAWRGFFG